MFGLPNIPQTSMSQAANSVTNVRERTPQIHATWISSNVRTPILREQNNKKDQQLERRDQQIDAMIERDRETNILIKGLQELMPQLGEGTRRTRPYSGRDGGTIVGDNPEAQA